MTVVVVIAGLIILALLPALLDIQCSGRLGATQTNMQTLLRALRVPILGTMLRRRELDLLLQHLAILPALQSARQALHNRVMQGELQAIIARVTTGQDMAVAWSAAPSF